MGIRRLSAVVLVVLCCVEVAAISVPPAASAAPGDGTVYLFRRDEDGADARLCIDDAEALIDWAQGATPSLAVAPGAHTFKALPMSVTDCTLPVPAAPLTVTTDQPAVAWTLTAHLFGPGGSQTFTTMQATPLDSCPPPGKGRLLAIETSSAAPGMHALAVPYVDGVAVPGAAVVGQGAVHTLTDLTAGSHSFVSKAGFPPTPPAVVQGPFTDSVNPLEITVWFLNTDASFAARIPLAFCDTPVPNPPANVSAVAGFGTVTVTWDPPSPAVPAPVTGYTVTADPGGQTCTWTPGPLTCTFSTLSVGTGYTFTATASNIAGPSAPSTPTAVSYPYDGSFYHPLTPTRILDSRTSTGGWNAKVYAGFPKQLQVTGLGGPSDVPAGATAVVMNVTATNASKGSFLKVWPTGTAAPNVSNLNFGPGETIANLATVKLGTGGTVSFANAVGGVHVIADVVGYYDDGKGVGDRFIGATPQRVLDSRTTTGGWKAKLAAGTARDLPVRQPSNPAGLPATATAVVANVTATGSTAGSFLSVWPSGLAQPNVSNLNFAAGQTIPNLTVVRIGTNDNLRFATAVGSTDVVVDVVGYFDSTTGSLFHAINPTRALDDRVGTGLTGPWGPGVSRALPIAGATGTGVPAGATGLVANVTATGATAGSFVTVYPDGVAQPPTSNLNFGVGQTIPNLVTVQLPANGTIDLANELGTVDLIADLTGYYAPY